MKALGPQEISSAASTLLRATKEKTPIDRISSQLGDFSVDDAYRIQLEGLKLRKNSGSQQVGWKMGLTSRSKREQMSLDHAIFGYLLAETWEKGDRLELAGLIHPKAEPEIAFRMKKTLRGKVDRAAAQAAIGAYAPAIEVIDSRYVGFKYFSLPDVIADNCSAGRFFIGKELPYDPKIDLASLKMKFSISGESVGEVLASEISGDPINSVVQLAELLEPYDLEIPEGAWVLAGSATTAVDMNKGRVFTLQVDGCAPLSVSVL